MPGLATELVRAPVDVLFTMGTRASRIVAETVKTTPLVVYSCDPFEHVTQIARGRGNLTAGMPVFAQVGMRARSTMRTVRDG
jgi:hypothetical protein